MHLIRSRTEDQESQTEERRTLTFGSRREDQYVGTETHCPIFICGLFSDIPDDKNLAEEAHEQIRLRMG